jgi:ABC-type spermidine/putrescine transport system permease subunit I
VTVGRAPSRAEPVEVVADDATVGPGREGTPGQARAPVWRERLVGLAMASPPLLVIGVFVGFPIAAAVAYTVGHGGGPNDTIASIGQHQHLVTTGWGTTDAYREVFSDNQFRRSLVATVVVTVVSVVAVMVLAWGIALYVRLTDSRVGRVLSALSVVPLFIPVVIASYAILTFYAGDGFVRTVADRLGWASAPVLSYRLSAVTLGSIWVNLPFAVLMITSGLAGVPTGLIEAARDAGASTRRTAREILLPLTLVPTVIAATFTAIGILGSFTLPYLVGPSAPNLLGPVMADTYSAYNRPQQSEVMAVVVFVLAAIAGVAYIWANLRSAARSGATR